MIRRNPMDECNDDDLVEIVAMLDEMSLVDDNIAGKGLPFVFIW